MSDVAKTGEGCPDVPGRADDCPRCTDVVAAILDERADATRPDVWERGVAAEEDIGHTIHRDASLEERAPQFAAMLAAGVEPTEQVPPGAFWSDARRKVHLPVAIEAADAKPCECSKRRKRPSWAREPQRACLPEHGCSPRTHALACIFARADERSGVAA